LTCKLLSIALCATACACATSALAQDDRFYVGGFAGGHFGEEQSFSGANLAGAPRQIDAPQDDGAVAGLVLGMVATEGGWGRLRVEAEFAHRQSDVERLSLNGVQRELLQGESSVSTQLVNLLYDTPQWRKLRGTLGAGIGAASYDYDIRYNVAAAGPTINIPTSVSGKLAYQAIIGVQYALTPTWELSADYRYLWGDDHQIERFNQTAGTLDSVLDATYESSAFTVGARYRF